MAPKLSVVVNTYNEAGVLPNALNSIKGLADEIVLIDMESSDNVDEVARKFGAKVYKHKHLNYVEPARNFGISKVTGEWVLILDPDEEVSDSLAKRIKEIIKNNEADYVRIPRKNIILNRWIEHAHWWPDYNIRLFRKGAVSWSEVIHAVPFTQGKGIDFDAKEELAIIHHHYNTLEQYIERMNRYTSIQADRKVKSGYKFSWHDILTKPTNEFLSRYFGDKGYKDGIHGLALSLLQGFSELVLYLKIWQAGKFKDEKVELSEVINEMREKERDLHYWQGDSMYKESGDIRDRVRRKLRI